MKYTLLLVACIACGPSGKRDGDSVSCEPGATQSCYTADAVTEGVGPCHGGTQQSKTAGHLL